jgi:hypothetical protein
MLTCIVIEKDTGSLTTRRKWRLIHCLSLCFVITDIGRDLFGQEVEARGENGDSFKGVVSRETCINGDHWCLV